MSNDSTSVPHCVLDLENMFVFDDFTPHIPICAHEESLKQSGMVTHAETLEGPTFVLHHV